MREINNNNFKNLNFKGVQKASEAQASQQDLSKDSSANAETQQTQDLAKMPGVTFGKSQISSDSLENDMKFFSKNPDAVSHMDAVFDKLLENHTYEEATQLMDAYKNEFFASKK